ncbi:MAG TPA: outer membrane beta-barrel protein [Ignavibacteria bacterium]|nr:outer membrane beta-barrel protein [Ignavibacteria bacterium]
MIRLNYQIRFTIKRILISIFVLFLFQKSVSAQKIESEEENTFYLGIGLSLSSYFGGNFGDRFKISYSQDESYYYDNSYYYEEPSYSLAPVQFSLSGGMNLNKKLSLELETSFISHGKGNIKNRDIIAGYDNGIRYTEAYDRARTIAIPILANIKFYPSERKNSSLYISAGGGYVYMNESIERTKTFRYTSSYYGNPYYYNDYKQTIGYWSAGQWMPGIKLASGMNFDIFGLFNGDVEISYFSFFPTSSFTFPLSLTSDTPVQSINLTSKFFFNF